jgi:catechol-2,3-dioxygenase
MAQTDDPSENTLPPIALADAVHRVKRGKDRRPRMEEPPPVSLVAVADVKLPAMRGLEHLLDDFYVGLLGFLKEEDGEVHCYRAENFCLRFDWREGLVERDSLRPLAIEIESLATLQGTLVEREIEFQIERGLVPGSQSILVADPAGNIVQVYESRLVG